MTLSYERLSRDLSSYRADENLLDEPPNRYVPIICASLDAPTVDSELIFVVTRPPTASLEGKLDVCAQAGGESDFCPPAGHLEVDRLSLERGLYAIYYTPKQEGVHTLNFLWNGEHLPMSPYTLVIKS